jgi:hypothetical protein
VSEAVVLSDDELSDLLTDPACPSAVLLGGRGAATVRADHAVAFVRARHPEAANVEAQIESFLSRVGGKRQEALDFNGIGRELAGRLLRRPRSPTSPPTMVYVVPARVFTELGRRPTNVKLPPGPVDG